jgi:hypothetical protein
VKTIKAAISLLLLSSLSALADIQPIVAHKFAVPPCRYDHCLHESYGQVTYAIAMRIWGRLRLY